eukprot:gene24667-29805_t
MLVYESFFCELLAPWLELRDLVRLDSGSCTAFHASLLTFLQSKQYGEQFGERLSFLSDSIDLFETRQESNIRFLSMLWICGKKANVTNISLRLDDVKLNVIAKMWKEGFVCHMVTSIDYRVSDWTSWIALVEKLSFHFPNVNHYSCEVIYMDIPISASYQLLKVLPSLADLELTSVVPDMDYGYEKFVYVLCKYCPKLQRLALRHIQDMLDDDVSALVEELPELETLELNMCMCSDLTEEVFVSLAETKRMWRYISVDNSLACGIHGQILHAIEELGLKVVTMRIRGDEDIDADAEERVVIRSWAGTSITGEEFRRRFRKELIEEEQ